MDFAHDRVGGPVLRGQALIEPSQRRRQSRVLITQPMDELDHERIGKHSIIEGSEDARDRFGLAISDPEQPVGEIVRVPARGAVVHGHLGKTPEILDQHDPQGDRNRP